MKEEPREHPIGLVLEGYATLAVPDELDLWPAIRRRLELRRRRVTWARMVPTASLAWSLLALALFALLGAVAYAVAPSFVGSLFLAMPFWRPIEEAQLAQELRLTQTLGGFTVTLERVYADTNQIVVGFTTSGPTDQKLHPTYISLRDDKSTIFPGLVGMGTDPTGTLGRSISLPPGTRADVFAFDASAVQGKPEVLRLRLEMQLVPLPQSSPTTAVGPFNFEFTVPFLPGRVVEVPQTIEAAGGTISLKRVAVTPSETRAILCFDLPKGEGRLAIPPVVLSTGAKDVTPAAIGSDREGNCHRYAFIPLYDQRGEWTLSVLELVWLGPTPPPEFTSPQGFVIREPAQPIKRLTGPWVFQFNVP